MPFNRFYLSATLMVGAAVSLASMPVQAAKVPHSLVTDARVKQVPYDPNQVYEVVGTYGYQTAIEFASDETVKVVTLGDSIAWQTVPYQNRLFLKPVEPNAATNLTVITDKRTYYFKLSSARNRAYMTFLIRFTYPNANLPTHSDGNAKRASHGLDLSKINLDYGTSGNKKTVALKRVFDDGQFTYFLFDQDAGIPSLYVVGPDGTETLVNFRREGQYLVVERTASLFTLRDGASYLCVQNNMLPYQRVGSAPVRRDLDH